MGRIRLKRIYDEPAQEDGFRVLVDRVWPRGVSKKAAAIDFWAQDLAPSTELRKWFNHDLKKWDDFRKRYREELDSHAAELGELIVLSGRSPITLLFAARDTEHNQAVVLKEALEKV